MFFFSHMMFLLTALVNWQKSRRKKGQKKDPKWGAVEAADVKLSKKMIPFLSSPLAEARIGTLHLILLI